ncbi:MAG: Uma2 family endonuclease [Planctomycetota bacterium]
MSTVATERSSATDGLNASVLDPRPAPTHLDADSNGMRMTVDEFQAVESWDRTYRFELIRGAVVVSPAVTMGGRFPRRSLINLLYDYSKTAAGLQTRVIVLDEHDLVTSAGVRRADLVVWCGRDVSPELKDAVPTIAIEIVSRGRRDRHRDFVEKRAEYFAIGVKEYWIFDRFRRTLTACSTGEGDAGRKVVREQENYETPLLPGFALSVGELLAECDAVGD